MEYLPNLKVNTPSGFPQPVAISIDDGMTWTAPGTLAEGTGFKLGFGFTNSGRAAAEDVTFQITLDGVLLYSGSRSSVNAGSSWRYWYGTCSLNPGTHKIVLTLDPENTVQESDESDNSFTYTVTVPGATNWLIKNYWGQQDKLPGSDLDINAYMPLDPASGKRCVTGCSNTAAALILSYFASQGHDFTIDLTADDAFTSGGRITIDATEESARKNGTLSFAEINALLEDFDADSPEDVAALCYASGVIAQSSFGSSATSTSSMGNKVFMRAGFKSAATAHKGRSDLWEGDRLSDPGWEMLIRNMNEKKPVFTSIPVPAHGIVIDGYDAQTDRIHINFGWGAGDGKRYDSSYGLYLGSGWYSRQECDTLQFREFVYDITPDTTVPAAGEISCQRNDGYVELSLPFSDDVGIWKSCYRVGSSGQWQEFTGSVRIENNGTVYFRACDRAKNYSEVKSFVVTGLANAPEPSLPFTLSVSVDTEAFTGGTVTVSLTSSGGSGTVRYFYKTGSGTWKSCSQLLRIEENCVLSLYALDADGCKTETVTYSVGNIDRDAPDVPAGLRSVTAGADVTVSWNAAADKGVSGLSHYQFRYGKSAALSGNGSTVFSNSFTLSGLAAGNWYYQVKSVDAAGNSSSWSPAERFSVTQQSAAALKADPDGLSWDKVPEAREYIVEYTAGGKGILQLFSKSNAVDVFALPEGKGQWQVRLREDENWNCSATVSAPGRSQAQKLVSDIDGNTDLFFANPAGIWEKGYAAEHSGILGKWLGTGEKVLLDGKNKVTDIFAGSSDANVLVLTDSSCGDALFADDIFSAFPESISRSRVLNIHEIRAGAGDDVIDLTSQRYIYSGNSLVVSGGTGDDVIWSNKGSNILFGDSGNDRITGGSGNDVIAGGSGNDCMHGGGGDDIFAFCGTWGQDTIEQLSGGRVTLWFESGSIANWDEVSLTYSDGGSLVTVLGDVQVTLKFGSTEELDIPGAFEAETGRRIFEEKNSGMLV